MREHALHWLDVGRLHAAARCARIFVRGPAGVALFVRRPGEAAAGLLARLERGEADEPRARLALRGPTLAALLDGDVALPEGSMVYAMFRERVAAPIAAADLLV